MASPSGRRGTRPPRPVDVRIAALVSAVVFLVIAVVGSGGRASPTAAPATTGPSTTAEPTRPTATPTPTAAPAALDSTPLLPDRVGRFRVDPPTAIRGGTVGRSSLRLTATYVADVDLAVGTGALRVAVTIDARNDDPEPIDRIELNTVAPRLGAMVLEGLTVDGGRVTATVDDQTIVVPLGGVLPPGERVRLRVIYSATIPNRSDGHFWLFTRADGVVALYRWLPWVSRAIAFNHDNFGDPFMTPVSPSVRVRLRTDRPVVVAASGPRVAYDDRDGTYAAVDVRDFTLILADDYRLTTDTVDGIQVNVLTRAGGLSGETMAALARRALAGYAAHLGPYPYPTLTIAESVAGYGLESPALVWIPRATSAANLRYLVPHEVAHQWFYALVSNDQANEPFADEAVADIMARDLMGMLRSPRCASDRLDRSIYDYTRACYFETVYVRGSLVLDRARDAMGNHAFWAALRGYLDAHRFGFGSTRELLEALDTATPADLRPIFEPFLPSAY